MLIGTAIRHWRITLAISTGLAGGAPIVYALATLSLHDWRGLLVCGGLTALASYALIMSRGFTDTDSLRRVDKIAVIGIGILSAVAVSIGLCAGYAFLTLIFAAFRGADVQPDRPVEVKVARNFWTGEPL
jgi:hypothetical protein